MPKAILEFKLPEELEEYQSAINGGKWSSVVFQTFQHIRNKVKYSELSEEQQKIYEDIREFINQQMDENNLEF